MENILSLRVQKIFFVGLGGAGQRHLRIFYDLLGPAVEYSAFRSVKKTPLLNADFTLAQGMIEQKYNLKLFSSLEAGIQNKPDLIVISTPSALHLEPALKAAQNKVHLFIEKPFSHNLDGFEQVEALVKKNNLAFFLSFQRRFHPQLQKVKEYLASERLGKIIQANFTVASYVPAWHPYENFRELYACKKELGGGVLLTEIHETDLCYWYFGMPEKVLCTGGNFSDVPMNVEDTAHLTLKYKNFSVQMNLCFMQKQNRREFFIAGSAGYLEWNQDGNRLLFVDYKNNTREEEKLSKLTNDDLFIEQAKYFLNQFQINDFSYLETAKATLQIVEQAKCNFIFTKL